MLGIELTDADVGNVPLLRTDPYGNFIPGAERLPAADHRHRRRTAFRTRPTTSSIVDGNPRDARPVDPTSPARSAPATPSSPTSPTTPSRSASSPTATSTIGLAIRATARPGIRQRAARRALHRRRRPRQREHRPDRRPPRLPLRAQPAGRAHQGRRAGRVRRPRPSSTSGWRSTSAALPTTSGRDRRAGLERRAPVPGRQVRHRDAVSAPGVRGVCPQDPADIDVFLVPDGYRRDHRPVDRRRVRARRLSLRPLDADRDRSTGSTRTSTPDQIGLIEAFLNPLAFDGRRRDRRRCRRRRHHPRHDPPGRQRDRRVRHRARCATTCSACRSTSRRSTWPAAATPACRR